MVFWIGGDPRGGLRGGIWQVSLSGNVYRTARREGKRGDG